MGSIGIVIPCYNEASRLPRLSFEAYISLHPDVSFCFVNDGSSDDTLEVLEAIRKGNPKQVMIHDLEHNVGKAEAVRLGMLRISEWKPFEYLGFLDADLATPLAEISHILGFNPPEKELAILFGSRVPRLGANIRRAGKRHYLGRIFATVASNMLQLPIYDTQCGAKFFRSDVVKPIFSAPFISRWLFDIELFFRAKALLGKSVREELTEVPLRVWHEVGKSRITYSDFLRFPQDLWRIFRVYRIKKKKVCYESLPVERVEDKSSRVGDSISEDVADHRRTGSV